VELDRRAIKRYLTTDESWLKHRWMAFRRKLQFPFTISFHDGPYRPHDITEAFEVDDDILRRSMEIPWKEGDETNALLGKLSSGQGYGTQ
jgi:hypothetical protein